MTAWTLLVAGCVVAGVLLLVPGTLARSRLPLAVSPRASDAPAPQREEPDGRRLRALAAAGTTVTTALLLPWPASVLAPVAGAVVWRRSRAWRTRAEQRREAELARDLPVLVDLVAAVVATGGSPDHAVRAAAPLVSPVTGQELAAAAARLSLGVDPATVWAALAEHPQLGRLGLALHRATDSGAPVEAALERLAEDLRAGRRAAADEAARQVEVRATLPLGLCLLPAFVLVAVVPLVAGAAGSLLPGR